MPEMTKEQLYIVLGVILILLIGCIYSLFGGNAIITKSSPLSVPQATASKTTQLQTLKTVEIRPKISIFVQISGAVAKEGLYKLAAGDRMIDLLKLSKPTNGADLDGINLAASLSDGQKVIVPSKASIRKAELSPDHAPKSSVQGAKVNINAADEKELDSLPGVGPAMAKKIVTYRENKGRFGAIDDIKKVSGISDKKFEQLKDLITTY
jgi:competence protein ComEA